MDYSKCHPKLTSVQAALLQIKYGCSAKSGLLWRRFNRSLGMAPHSGAVRIASLTVAPPGIIGMTISSLSI